MSQPNQQHLEVLKQYFGHSEFRPKQWEIIRAVCEEHRDVCTIMATGYGKSLCYQFPPVYCNGLGIVISPLISLMQDQILALKMSNIPACCFGSAQTDKENTRIGVINGQYRLMYVAPEWCVTEYAEELLSTLSANTKKYKITLVAIDEAHCISQWGFDFRPSYRGLGKLRELLPDVPFMAVTATATPQVREDICRSLKLMNPLVICTHFDRPNLYLAASVKSDDILKDLKSVILNENVKNIDTGPTIIYCPTKKVSEEVASILNRNGFKCSSYHADVSLKLRKQIHEDFVRDKLQIVVATIAFGMGIDKPDVRMVIHYGAPKDLESYYQEIGRAGRDGLPSYCHVFHSQADFSRNEFFFQNLSGKYLEHKRKLAQFLERFVQTKGCRRKMLLSHFDPNVEVETYERCCDNCSNCDKATPHFDITGDALLILKAVKALGGHYGLNMSVFLLKGSAAKRFPKKFCKHELYGVGRDKSESWWKCLGNLLLREGLLQKQTSKGGWNKTNFPVHCVGISTKGEHYLETNGKDVFLEITDEMLSLRKFTLNRNEYSDQWISLEDSGVGKRNTSSSSDVIDNPDKLAKDFLYDNLLILRAKLAKDFECMPYMIANVGTLRILSIKKPKTLEELSSIDGFTEAKINNFGQEFINAIVRRYQSDESLCDNSSIFDNESQIIKEQSQIVNTDGWCDTNEMKNKSVQDEDPQESLKKKADLDSFDDYFLNINEDSQESLNKKADFDSFDDYFLNINECEFGPNTSAKNSEAVSQSVPPLSTDIEVPKVHIMTDKISDVQRKRVLNYDESMSSSNESDDERITKENFGKVLPKKPDQRAPNAKIFGKKLDTENRSKKVKKKIKI